MKIDFTPSVKTIEKMHRIDALRKQGVYWEDVAKEIGHTKRYATALYKKYKEMLAIADKVMVRKPLGVTAPVLEEEAVSGR